MFRTTGGTPYLFHFHVADIGNIAMFGPTGSGKTTLLLFLLAQAEKLGVTTVFFDKDRGGEILSRALGRHLPGAPVRPADRHGATAGSVGYAGGSGLPHRLGHPSDSGWRLQRPAG